MNEKKDWQGMTDEIYEYLIYPIGTNFPDEPGNYIYAKVNSLNEWKAVYIGQTSSLRDRLANHEQEPCAIRNEATHIHAHTSSSDEQIRKGEEADLIINHEPVCND